jgi:4-hydroxybenzoate polyprenyltransferase
LLHYYNDLSFEEFENYKGLCRYFLHASFLLYSVTLIRGKDLENKGNLANNYKTIPIVYGEMVSNKIITALALTILPVYVLIEIYDVGYMDIYF